MALIACRECSEQVSDTAATCPRCGVAAPAGLAEVTFSRRGLVNAGTGVDVIVDGVPHGRTRFGGSVSASLTPGEHLVQLVPTSGRASDVLCTIEPGVSAFAITYGLLGVFKLRPLQEASVGTTSASDADRADGRPSEPVGPSAPAEQARRRTLDAVRLSNANSGIEPTPTDDSLVICPSCRSRTPRGASCRACGATLST